MPRGIRAIVVHNGLVGKVLEERIQVHRGAV